MDLHIAGPSTAEQAVDSVSTFLPEQTPAQPSDKSTQKGWHLFDDCSDHSCNCCLIWCNYCIQNFELNPEMLEHEGKMLPKRLNAQRPGVDQLVKRVYGQNGIMLRGVDLRHMPRWIDQSVYFMRKFVAKPTFVDAKGKWRREPKALDFNLEERENLVINEPFGMSSYSVPYSLGKHQRWQFNEYFEENPQDFQHPNQNVTAILMSSDQLPTPEQIYAEQFPPLINGFESKHRVRQMIAAEANGKIYTKETKTGRALPVDLLRPVQPIAGPHRQQPKHKKAARRYRRREMLRKRNECQEAPIRLVYFIEEPRPTSRQIQSSAVREKFTGFLHGKKCPRSQKHRGLLIQDEDCEYYEESMDFFDFTEEPDHVYVDQLEDEVEKPRGFSLGDFIAEDLHRSSTLNYVVVQHPMELNFIQISPQQLNRSTGSVSSLGEDYELVDGFEFST